MFIKNSSFPSSGCEVPKLLLYNAIQIIKEKLNDDVFRYNTNIDRSLFNFSCETQKTPSNGYTDLKTA